MKTKETWIDETLNSLEGIRRAPADPDLFLKIQARAILRGKTTSGLWRTNYWPIAAGLAFLITLNIFGTLYYQHGQTTSLEVPAAVATDYLSYLSPINL